MSAKRPDRISWPHAPLHELSARGTWINRLENAVGRKVWHNFWETRLTYKKSYLARPNYVHQNPVKHGLVAVASQYPWCSASWFERVAKPSQVKTIYGFKTDKLKILDEYDVALGMWFSASQSAVAASLCWRTPIG